MDMERFFTTDWAANPGWSFIIAIVLIAAIIIGAKLTRAIATEANAKLAELWGGKFGALPGLLKNYGIGVSGSSVIVFSAMALGGFMIQIQDYVIVIVGIWTYFLISDYLGQEQVEGK